MAAKIVSVLVVVIVTLAFAGSALAKGGNYVIDGGSPEAQATVRSALEASRFDWSRVPVQVTIQITNCGCAGAQPGTIVLDESMLTSSAFGARYAWGIVQHEYAHQVDFFLLTTSDRRAIRKALGGADWCNEAADVAHDQHGCERFAEAFAWSYWPRQTTPSEPPSVNGTDRSGRPRFGASPTACSRASRRATGRARSALPR
jgi:hypothetical protein